MSEAQVVTLVTILIGGGLIVAGFATLLVAFRWRAQANASLRWPSVMGRVLHIGVRWESVSDANNHVGFPEVQYEYVVGGRGYRSGRIAHTPSSGYTESELPKLEADMIAYGVGAPVQVFYNPNNPAHAVLEHGAPRARIMMILSIIFIPIGIAIVAVAAILNALVLNQS